MRNNYRRHNIILILLRSWWLSDYMSTQMLWTNTVPSKCRFSHRKKSIPFNKWDSDGMTDYADMTVKREDLLFLADRSIGRAFGTLCRLSVCRLWRFVCCKKLSEGANRKPGSKSWFFGSPPLVYFRFRLYGHRDGRFCLIFARTAQRSVIDGTNGHSSSKPCAYCQIVRSELKPEVVLTTIIDPERCK